MALGAILLMNGCTLGLGQAGIKPDVTPLAASIKLSGPVVVTVYDERAVSWLGDPGAVGGHIDISDTLGEGVKQAIEATLEDAGMTPDNSSEAPQFQVYIDTLNYSIPAGEFLSYIDLTANIRVNVRTDEGTYQNIYSARERRSLKSVPEKEDSLVMVNEILTMAINRAFEDRKLIDYIGGL